MTTATALPATKAEKTPKPKAVKTKAASKPVKKTVNTPDTVTQNSTAPTFSFVPYQAGDNEEYMSDEQLAHFKAILLGWKAQLIEEAESTK